MLADGRLAVITIEGTGYRVTSTGTSDKRMGWERSIADYDLKGRLAREFHTLVPDWLDRLTQGSLSPDLQSSKD